ncbi:hypothetical protein SUGI_0002230 [Cryptomeria japonica]|nr:hypothetical protein SUGI_0002230 [Cryptomeria japonica]
MMPAACRGLNPSLLLCGSNRLRCLCLMQVKILQLVADPTVRPRIQPSPEMKSIDLFWGLIYKKKRGFNRCRRMCPRSRLRGQNRDRWISRWRPVCWAHLHR